MEINLYTVTIVPMIRTLENLSKILDKAAKHADSKKTNWAAFEDALMQDRLVFDQFPFIKQVQLACDNGKAAAARLSGKVPPKHPDNEKTVKQLKARIDKTIKFMKSVKEKNIAGRDNDLIELPHYFDGKKIYGYDYAVYYIMPNFYFHVTTAYAILRKNGVAIGKDDYLGALNLK